MLNLAALPGHIPIPQASGALSPTTCVWLLADGQRPGLLAQNQKCLEVTHPGGKHLAMTEGEGSESPGLSSWLGHTLGSQSLTFRAPCRIRAGIPPESWSEIPSDLASSASPSGFPHTLTSFSPEHTHNKLVTSEFVSQVLLLGN